MGFPALVGREGGGSATGPASLSQALHRDTMSAHLHLFKEISKCGQVAEAIHAGSSPSTTGLCFQPCHSESPPRRLKSEASSLHRKPRLQVAACGSRRRGEGSSPLGIALSRRTCLGKRPWKLLKIGEMWANGVKKVLPGAGRLRGSRLRTSR